MSSRNMAMLARSKCLEEKAIDMPLFILEGDLLDMFADNLTCFYLIIMSFYIVEGSLCPNREKAM